MPEGLQYEPSRRGVLGMLGGGAAAAATTGTALVPRKPEEEISYADLAVLKRQFQDYAAAKNAEGHEMLEARHYYHGDQWTARRDRDAEGRASSRSLRQTASFARSMPSSGWSSGSDKTPKPFARTPKHDMGAEVATGVLRYVLDSNDWASKSSRIARGAGIDGLAGIEYDLVPGDTGDPSLEMHIVYGDGFFYDPRSYDEGFTDCRFLGVAKWCDKDQVKEIAPDKAAEIEDLTETGSDLVNVSEFDREKNWVNSTSKKVRMIDHWYIKGGKWRWCLYAGNVMLMRGVSPLCRRKRQDVSALPDVLGLGRSRWRSVRFSAQSQVAAGRDQPPPQQVAALAQLKTRDFRKRRRR